MNLVDQKGGELPLETELLRVEIVVIEVVVSLVLGWAGEMEEGKDGFGNKA